jgi:hypothetical protein
MKTRFKFYLTGLLFALVAVASYPPPSEASTTHDVVAFDTPAELVSFSAESAIVAPVLPACSYQLAYSHTADAVSTAVSPEDREARWEQSDHPLAVSYISTSSHTTDHLLNSDNLRKQGANERFANRHTLQPPNYTWQRFRLSSLHLLAEPDSNSDKRKSIPTTLGHDTAITDPPRLGGCV